MHAISQKEEHKCSSFLLYDYSLSGVSICSLTKNLELSRLQTEISLSDRIFLQKLFHQINVVIRLNDESYMPARNIQNFCIQLSE